MGIGRFSYAAPLALVLLCKVAGAQATQAAPSHPDFTGYYFGKRTPEYVPLDDGKPVLKQYERERVDLIVPHLQPWAKLLMDSTDGTADDSGATCQPAGFWRYQLGGDGVDFALIDGKNMFTWISGEIEVGGVLRIYLNRQHPRNLRPTWNGDAVGHWEGDTLVVDVVGFNDKSWIEMFMTPHSEELHVTHRLRMMPNTNLLRLETKMEDRKAFTSAFTFTRYFERRKPDWQFGPERPCNEQDLENWNKWRRDALQRDLKRAAEVKQ